MKKQITLKQDKVVKHSVRYSVEGPDFNMSIYVPKVLLLPMPSTDLALVNGWPAEIHVTISTEKQA